MSFATTHHHHDLHGDGTPAYGADDPLCYQVLELRLRFVHRLISPSPYAGAPPQILRQTAPIPLGNALFPLPLHRLEHPQFLEIYVAQLLSSVRIRGGASAAISWQVASYVSQMAGGDRGVNFHVVADIDYVQTTTWHRNGGAVGEETVILEEAPPERRRRRRGSAVPHQAESATGRLRMEKLEEEEGELGDCSICLDGMDCKRKEVVKIPCGHAYHKSCISKWLNNYNSNSYPLCRKPLPLVHDH